MTNFEKPLDLSHLGLTAVHALPSAATIKTTVLSAMLIAYGLGLAALYPLVQTSAAKSAAEGNDPALFVVS
jgi:hypothetical protein